MAPAKSHTDEPRWHSSLAVIAILVLYCTLPAKLTIGPTWLALVLVLGLLIPLSILAPRRHAETVWQRAASVTLIAVVNLFNLASVVLLTAGIVTRHAAVTDGVALLQAGGQIWLTNVLVFGLWYWEIDGGGPAQRSRAPSAMAFETTDFLFPQMMLSDERLAAIDRDWKPLFLDYLYVAFTDALAFSPTDAMPISRTVKMLMAMEAIISFLTVAIVVSRAVGIIQ
jgi:hypothetical protein